MYGEEQIVRVTHDDLDSGEVLFTRDEIGTMELVQLFEPSVVQTQFLDRRVYYRAPSGHWRIQFELMIATYDTLIKWNDVRNLRDEFVVYPFWHVSTQSYYTVVIENPDGFVERWLHGFPAAHDGDDEYIIPVSLIEPRGETCLPPS